MSIEVRGVTKIYEAAAVLHGIDLEVGSGELVALLGPSGCGKTTLLRIIAGLEAPDAGSVRVSGEDTAALAARERRVGFVFQHYALFRRMSVFDNVAFGLQVRPRRERPPREAIRARVMELLRLVQLERYAERSPGQLSGGQQQRVALARALAVEPKVLLLDEPFGSLDARVRRELRLWLRRLHDELHVTSVFVTHDQEEALEVADRVVLMNDGRIEQVGSPQEVWEHPRTPFVLDFLGSVNLFRGRVHRGRLSIGDWEIDVPEHAGTHAAAAVGYVRAHELEVARAGGDDAGLAASILAVRRLGPVVRIEMQRLDTEETFEASLSAERFAELDLHPGETVFARPSRVRVFVDQQERPGQSGKGEQSHLVSAAAAAVHAAKGDRR
jgi:sulfate transport system ATP-binding protein